MKIKFVFLVTLALVMLIQVGALAQDESQKYICQEQRQEVTIRLGHYFSYTLRPWDSMMAMMSYTAFDWQEECVLLSIPTSGGIMEIGMEKNHKYSISITSISERRCVCILDIKILEIGPGGEYVTLDWHLRPLCFDK